MLLKNLKYSKTEVYTILMNTINLSLMSTHVVAEGFVFRKHTVVIST